MNDGPRIACVLVATVACIVVLITGLEKFVGRIEENGHGR